MNLGRLSLVLLSLAMLASAASAYQPTSHSSTYDSTYEFEGHGCRVVRSESYDVLGHELKATTVECQSHLIGNDSGVAIGEETIFSFFKIDNEIFIPQHVLEDFVKDYLLRCSMSETEREDGGFDLKIYGCEYDGPNIQDVNGADISAVAVPGLDGKVVELVESGIFSFYLNVTPYVVNRYFPDDAERLCDGDKCNRLKVPLDQQTITKAIVRKYENMPHSIYAVPWGDVTWLAPCTPRETDQCVGPGWSGWPILLYSTDEEICIAGVSSMLVGDTYLTSEDWQYLVSNPFWQTNTSQLVEVIYPTDSCLLVKQEGRPACEGLDCISTLIGEWLDRVR